MPRGTWLREGQCQDRPWLSLLLRVQLLGHPEFWRLLSTGFHFFPLLNECVSLEEEKQGLVGHHVSIPCASIPGLCLSGAAALGEGAPVFGIGWECSRGCSAGVGKYRFAFTRDFIFPQEKRVASECQPSLPVSSQLHHGIKLLIPFIPFWE